MPVATPRQRFLVWRWGGAVLMLLGAAAFVSAPEPSSLLTLWLRPDLHVGDMAGFP